MSSCASPLTTTPTAGRPRTSSPANTAAVAAAAVPARSAIPAIRRLAAAVAVGAADLDPQGALQSLRVRRPQHRKARRQPIPTGRRHASADARRVRERAVEQQRIGELGAVAVRAPDRFGEPAQLAPTSGPALDPLAVMPTRCEPGQRPVVLAGARRAGRAVHRDVDLVATPRAARRGGGRSTPTSPGDIAAPTTSVASDSRNTSSSASNSFVSSSRSPTDTTDTPISASAAAGGACSPATASTTTSPFDKDGVNASTAVSPGLFTIATAIAQQSRDPTADDAVADDSGAQPRSGSSSWRHPPCCGGVPPLPRTRNAAAIAAASASAASTLRRTLTSGAPVGQQGPKGTGSSSAKHVISTAGQTSAGGGVPIRRAGGDSAGRLVRAGSGRFRFGVARTIVAARGGQRAHHPACTKGETLPQSVVIPPR